MVGTPSCIPAGSYTVEHRVTHRGRGRQGIPNGAKVPRVASLDVPGLCWVCGLLTEGIGGREDHLLAGLMWIEPESGGDLLPLNNPPPKLWLRETFGPLGSLDH